MPKSQSAEELLNSNAKNIAQTAENDFRRTAEASGWPQDVINSVSVTYSNGNLKFDYPDDMENKIRDLEEGNGAGTAPTFVMGKLKYRSDKYLESSLNATVLDRMIMEAGALNG